MLNRARWFAGGITIGVAAGFVAGSRAGRATYEALIVGAKRVLDDPRVRAASTAVHDQAARLYEDGRRRILLDGGSEFTDDADLRRD